MVIPQEQIEFRRKVGKAKGQDVFHVKTRGGLHLMASATGKILGSGPHRAVARKIAAEFEPDVEWSELSKSDHIDTESFEHLLPKYREITDRMRTIQGNK